MAKNSESKNTGAKNSGTEKTGTEKTGAKTSKAPGEVRNNLQVVVRILVALIIVIVVGGFLWALFRRPERVIENSQRPPAASTLLEA